MIFSLLKIRVIKIFLEVVEIIKKNLSTFWAILNKPHRKRMKRSCRCAKESLEQILEKRTLELKQAHIEKMNELYRFAELGRLSSAIFHDLMNPLTALTLNMNELETKNYKGLPEIKTSLKRACEATRKMEKFVAMIRKQIRDQGPKTTFSLNEEVEQAINILSYKARKLGVMVYFHSSQNIMFFGNSMKFHQIIINLLSNAIDAYDFRGRKNSSVVDIFLEKEKGVIVLKVLDKGCGIDAQICSKIFDPFFTTKLKEGMGLGLSTAKHITEKEFAGSIQVKSALGQGSLFTVSFPFISEK